MDEKENSDDNSTLKRAMFIVSDAVLGAAFLLVIGVWGGSWLDKQFHTAPWFSTGLALLGGGFGLARMVIKANQLQSLPSPRVAKAVSTSEKKPKDKSAPRNPFDDFEDEQD